MTWPDILKLIVFDPRYKAFTSLEKRKRITFAYQDEVIYIEQNQKVFFLFSFILLHFLFIFVHFLLIFVHFLFIFVHFSFIFLHFSFHFCAFFF